MTSVHSLDPLATSLITFNSAAVSASAGADDPLAIGRRLNHISQALTLRSGRIKWSVIRLLLSFEIAGFIVAYCKMKPTWRPRRCVTLVDGLKSRLLCAYIKSPINLRSAARNTYAFAI